MVGEPVLEARLLKRVHEVVGDARSLSSLRRQIALWA
jgi:hypothetical protein